MILMLQIFDVTANENARYKRNELELYILACKFFLGQVKLWNPLAQWLGRQGAMRHSPINSENGP